MGVTLFWLKKSLWDWDENGRHFTDDWVLWALESLTVSFLSLHGNYNSALDWSLLISTQVSLKSHVSA